MKFNLFSVTGYIEINYPYNCFAVTMYQSLLMALVFLLTFLCTLKTRAWISKCNCKSKYTFFDETDVKIQDCKWWLPHVWNSTTYYANLLKILASSLYRFFAIYNSCSFTFFLNLPADHVSPLHSILINRLSSPGMTQNYIYNAYSHKWHKRINYTLNTVDSNHCYKEII